MNHAGTSLVPLIMPLRHDLVKKIISAYVRRCFIGARIRRRERIILSQERDVIANHEFMTISSVVNQDGAVIVPHEATIVLLNEPTKGQDGWASLQEENPRVGIEPRDLDIHHIRGGSGAVRSGHTDHGSITPKRFAKLVREALLTSEMIS